MWITSFSKKKKKKKRMWITIFKPKKKKKIKTNKLKRRGLQFFVGAQS